MTPRALALALALSPCPFFAAGCDGAAAPPSPGDAAEVAADPAAAHASSAPTAGATDRADEAEQDKPAPPPIENDAGPKLLARVLSLAVTDGGLVRYDMFADRELLAALDRVVTWYDRNPVPADRVEKLAFLCNAYNANILARAYRESTRPGFESVVKVEGFFDTRPIRVGRESMTFNDLENSLIRPLGDARIHAALVCAAMSCPPLRAEPYRAETLDAQLDDQCKRWVNDPAKFRIVDGELGLSTILNWYGEDFDGPPYGNRVGFVLAYADPAGELARFIVNRDGPEIRWLEYDWTLNRAR